MLRNRKRAGYGGRPTFGQRAARTTFGSRPIMRRRRAYVAQRSRAGKSRNLRTGGFLGIEYKFLDCAWNAVGIGVGASGTATGGELPPSSGCTAAISVPAQGDGESNRDGRKYVIKSVYFNGVVNTATKSDQADAVDLSGTYFALVLDTQTNGAAAGPDSETVFVNPTTSAIGILPQPLRNLQQSKRFRILDSCYVPPGGAYAFNDAAATGSIAMQNAPTVKLSWKGNIVCDSTGTTAASASAADNAIFVMAFGGESAFNSFSGKSRVRFVG